MPTETPSERKFIVENVKRMLIKDFIRKKIEEKRAGFGWVDIQRTPMGTRIGLAVQAPGLVIGRSGDAIKNLTQMIEKRFDVENPQIEIKEIKNMNLDANIMAQRAANAIERGWKYRRVGHSTVRRIMNAGAKGCQVIIAGKLTGERHRTAKFTQGHIKYSGEFANKCMRVGYAVAVTKPGIIGVKVKIMPPDAKTPDEIHIADNKTPKKETVTKEEEKVIQNENE